MTLGFLVSILIVIGIISLIQIGIHGPVCSVDKKGNKKPPSALAKFVYVIARIVMIIFVIITALSLISDVKKSVNKRQYRRKNII